ncbi:hypothetical protein ACS5NO_12860 [Larkinella sp. GY13]|uniref:hypothetical protein n=1 Tax=Larkinella sp. GY13 TaxID=3453720 RepID=UPI003EE8B125
MIQTAQKYVGTRETGENRGQPARLFMQPYGYPPGTPWCGLFVHHIFTTAHVQHGVKGPALAANWAIPATAIVSRSGRMTTGRVPVAGDLALYRFQSRRINHIEIIVRWALDDDETYFWALGGNTSNPANARQQGVYIKKRLKHEAYLVINRIDPF